MSTSESTFVNYLSTVAASPDINPALREHLLGACAVLASSSSGEDAPFLTVLLRTQGRRPEFFKDSLLCLSAQTDQDFEVVILEHNATPDEAATVRGIIERLPSEFGQRVSLLEVEGGSRARPLNRGIEVARGRFIAVFDDDDLLFANWVESFRAAEGDGARMLRAIVGVQEIAPEVWPQGQAGYRTATWPKAAYADHFEPLDHTVVNHSPFMSWAFPRVLFDTFGVRFDEELAVCEDWDVILRGSLLCGVTDVEALTSIYRRWTDGESSYTVHSSDEWRDSEKRVTDRLNSHPVLFPPGTFDQIRQVWAEDVEALRVDRDALLSSKSWKMTAPLRSIRIIANHVRVVTWRRLTRRR